MVLSFFKLAKKTSANSEGIKKAPMEKDASKSWVAFLNSKIPKEGRIRPGKKQEDRKKKALHK